MKLEALSKNFQTQLETHSLVHINEENNVRKFICFTCNNIIWTDLYNRNAEMPFDISLEKFTCDELLMQNILK